MDTRDADWDSSDEEDEEDVPVFPNKASSIHPSFVNFDAINLNDYKFNTNVNSAGSGNGQSGKCLGDFEAGRGDAVASIAPAFTVLPSKMNALASSNNINGSGSLSTNNHTGAALAQSAVGNNTRGAKDFGTAAAASAAASAAAAAAAAAATAAGTVAAGALSHVERRREGKTGNREDNLMRSIFGLLGEKTTPQSGDLGGSTTGHQLHSNGNYGGDGISASGRGQRQIDGIHPSNVRSHCPERADT